MARATKRPPTDTYAAYRADVLRRVDNGLARQLGVAERAGHALDALPSSETLAGRMLAGVPSLAGEDALGLLAAIGDVYTTEALGRWLGVSRQALHDRAARLTLLACRTAEGTTYWPAWQFQEDGTPVRGLREILAAFANLPVSGWTVAQFLNTPNPDLDGLSPVGWLAAGRDAGAAADAAREQTGLWAN